MLIWEKAYKYLKRASQEIKNKNLLEACEYAYKRGLEKKLNTDYRMIEADLICHNQLIKASIWVDFKEDKMVSKLTLEKGKTVVFEKILIKLQLETNSFLKCTKV